MLGAAHPVVFPSTVIYILDNVRFNGTCVEWTGRNWVGSGNYKYGSFTDTHSQFQCKRKRQYPGAHRVLYEMAYGPIPDGLCVCHRCDNPACVNPAHLFLGTDKDNIQDSITKGRFFRNKKRRQLRIVSCDCGRVVETRNPQRQFCSSACRIHAWHTNRNAKSA